MKKKLPLIIILAFTLTIIISAGLIYKSFRSDKLTVPFFAPTPSQSLSMALENASVTLQSPPKIYSSRIEASISAVTVYFSKDKDFVTQVRALQLVRSRLKMDSRSPKVIDVRLINKVILKY